MGCTQSSTREPAEGSVGNASNESPTRPRAGSRIAALTRPSHGANAGSSVTQRSRARLRTPRPWSNNTSNPTQALWTPSSLARERTIFFETRVSGQPEIWSALALAIDMIRGTSENQRGTRDLSAAQSVIDAAGISVPRGRLEDGAWDERGVYYQIPQWVLSDPVDSRADADMESVDAADDEADEVEKEGLGESKQTGTGEILRIKARLSDGGTDVTVSVRDDQSIATLINAIREGANIPTSTQVRIAYLGKILKENQSLLAQGWQKGHAVNALVFS